MKYDLNDTIAAIATSPGEAGIGIVRLSGAQAIAIADEIFLSGDKKKPSAFKTHTIHYGWIVKSVKRKAPACPAGRQNVKQKTDIVDEVLLTVMRSPRTYTREDIVEINCHGGIVALRAVLELVLSRGCRIAQPGEFTKRAFLNGRIDLAQAEAVLDVIKAKTDAALKISTGQLKGGLSASLNQIRDLLLRELALWEANIDFPEEETELADRSRMFARLKQARARISAVLQNASCGRILREGISVVICGKPNVGKSSLLNTLLRQERSIVTSVAGTTRDTIEEVIDIQGIPIRIVDTAGILEPRDLIEKKAVQRARQCIAQAEVVILLFDASKKLTRQDDFLIRKLKKKTVLAVINKIDLRPRIDKDKLLKNFKSVIGISAKKAKNIGLLEEAIAAAVYREKISPGESPLVSNFRHIQGLKKAEILIAEILDYGDNNKLSAELVAQNIKDAAGYLDEILGKRFSEELLDEIFTRFCIGK